MRDLKLVIPAVLAAQGLLVHWAAGGERPPEPPDLAGFPASVGPWKQLREDPIEPGVQEQLQADRLLSRTYLEEGGPRSAQLLVAWFRSQATGGQPHSPQVC